MLHIVSYSFPPDNVPAAHRPYQLARYCAEHGIPFVVHSSRGRIADVASFAAVAGSVKIRRGKNSDGLRRLFRSVTDAVAGVVQLDKGIPWAARTLPRLIADIRADDHAGKRPVVWATAPLVSNLTLGWAASALTGAELHVDLRDAVDGINSRRMPWFTRKVLERARTITTVSPSISKMIGRRVSLDAKVVYNGISEDSFGARVPGGVTATGWIDVAYIGALYGGDRPYQAAIELLRRASELLPADVRGIRLKIATREALDESLTGLTGDRFFVEHCGELSKPDALALAAESHVNLLLVGSGEIHRCAIPLKTYDLLGVGRPILYFGPADADALGFLQTYAPRIYYAVDSESDASMCDEPVSRWLNGSLQVGSIVLSEPSAISQSRLIMEIVGGSV